MCLLGCVFRVSLTAFVVKSRALSKEPDAGQLMTSDQEGKDLAEPEEQQAQEVRKKKTPLLVKYFSCVVCCLFSDVNLLGKYFGTDFNLRIKGVSVLMLSLGA